MAYSDDHSGAKPEKVNQAQPLYVFFFSKYSISEIEFPPSGDFFNRLLLYLTIDFQSTIPYEK
jgi:hypothetical protein